MARNTTLDNFFEVETKSSQQNTGDKNPQNPKTGYCLTSDMLKMMDIDDIKDILSTCPQYALDYDSIFIDRDDRIKYEDRSTYSQDVYQRDRWYGDLKKTTIKGQRGPKVNFTVVYLGELTDQQKILLYAEEGFAMESGTKYYVLRGRVYLSGFKMRNRNEKQHAADDFIKYDENIYKKLVQNYNKKCEMAL